MRPPTNNHKCTSEYKIWALFLSQEGLKTTPPWSFDSWPNLWMSAAPQTNIVKSTNLSLATFQCSII